VDIASGHVVVIHLASIHAPNIRVFTLDTGRLPPETFELVEDVRQRYGIIVESWLPDRRAARPAVTQPEARR